MLTRNLAAATVATVIVVAAALAAADSAADRCGGNKMRATAKYAKGAFSCEAKALRKGQTVDPACLARAAAKAARDFARAEALGGCVTAEDEDEVSADVDAALAEALALLDPDSSSPALKCASAKLASAGTHIRGRLLCYGKGALRSLGPRQACLDKTGTKLAAGFAKAERPGGCTTTDDLAAVDALDRDTSDALVRRLSPVCGDDLQGPLQECDGGDDATCPGLCTQTCGCDFPAVCGDGVAKLPEECDDGNTDGGDGCSADCLLEDASALCAGVAATAGTAIDAVLVSDDFTVPLFVTAPPLDVARLFVVERAGYVRILDLATGAPKPTPFLDISSLTTTAGERGFFSMAFDPAYAVNGRFYVSYTDTSGDLVLARYEVDAGDPDLADPSTREELLVIPHPGAANHNGGQLQFGGDGYLYWGMGDGGASANAQSDASMLGKMLRLDVDHDAAPFVTVPPTNPGYVDGTGAIEYVWAKGLRNPWRFSFDRETGDLYIGDVGGSYREEISFAPGTSVGGENYGWRIFEGNRCNESSCPDPPTGFTMPVHDYPHPGGCAVMGGYAYRGCAMPDMAGTYFFSDLCGGFIRTFEVVGGTAVNFTDRTSDARPPGYSFMGARSWGEDARGEIYIMNGSNQIFRIVPD